MNSLKDGIIVVGKLRIQLGRWLLKPHWLPLLEHYTKMQINNPHGKIEAERCTYIVIGIKKAINR